MDEQAAQLERMPSLFDRVPDRLFMPLASPSRRHYWELLLYLYDEYFGETVQLPEEVEQGEITFAIERYLKDCPEWVGQPEDDMKARHQTLNSRANAMLRQLMDCGWLLSNQVALRKLIEMPPEVQELLEQLRAFAEDGPATIGGEVLQIYSTLKYVEKEPLTYAATLNAGAKDVRGLIKTLAHTRNRVNEYKRHMLSMDDANQVVNAFFDYISEIYIADYKDLNTSNHPLRLRRQILDIVRRLQNDEAKMEQLIKGYRQARIGGNHPERQLYRDIERFLQFEHIDRHLDRLQQAVQSLHHQALAYFQYQTYTPTNITQQLDYMIERVNALPESAYVTTSLQPDQMLFYGRLRDYSARKPVRRRTSCRKQPMTPEQRAKHALRRIMLQSRDVSAAAIAKHLDGYLGDRQSLSSDELSIESPRDFTTALALPLYALAASQQRERQSWQLPGFSITIDRERRSDNQYINMPYIHIQRTVERDAV